MGASFLLNFRSRNSRRNRRISYAHQMMMWYSGLRGAMAFALAMDLRNRTDNGPIFLTTTLIIVLCTVILLGGFTTKMLELLHISMGDNLTESETPYVESWWQRFDRKYTKPIFTREATPRESNDNIVVHKDHVEDLSVEVVVDEEPIEQEEPGKSYEMEEIESEAVPIQVEQAESKLDSD